MVAVETSNDSQSLPPSEIGQNLTGERLACPRLRVYRLKPPLVPIGSPSGSGNTMSSGPSARTIAILAGGLLCASLLVVAVLVGERPSDARLVASLLAPDATPTILDPGSFAQFEELERIHWDRELSSLQRAHPSLELRIVDEALEVRVPNRELDLALPLQSAAISAVEIETWGFGRRAAELHLGSSLQPGALVLEAQPGPFEPGDWRRYRFSTRGAPASAGTLRLRIRLPPAGTGKIRLARAGRLRDGVHITSEQRSSSYLVPVGREFRHAVLADASNPRCFETTPARNSAFSTSALLLTGTARNAWVEVSAGRQRTRVVQEVSTDAWADLELSLGDWARQRATICLGLSSEGGGIVAWSAPSLLMPVAPHQRKPDVLLVSIDTLRADRLSLYGHSRRTSPNLDRWAANSAQVVTRTLSAAPWTLPSHASIFTGLEAWRHGVNYSSPAPPGLTFLAERLKQEGYETAAIVGGGYLHPSFGLLQGFDFVSSAGSQMGNEAELSDGVAAALAWRRTSDRTKPSFLLFHTYAVHNPYRVHTPHLAQLTGKDPPADLFVNTSTARNDEFLRPVRNLILSGDRSAWPQETPIETIALDLYDSAIAATDAAIAPLLDEYRTSESVVVVTSDHGELFGEHGYVNHFTLFEENLSVPLIIGAPGLSPGSADLTARGVDVTPTILDLVSIELDPGFDGMSLAGVLRGSVSGQPAEAWAYAAASAFGVLHIDLERKWRYIYDDTAGARPGPRESWEPDLGSHVPGEAPPSPEDQQRIRRAVGRALAAGPSPAIVRLEAGAEPLSGCLLESHPDPTQAKLLTPDAPIRFEQSFSPLCFRLEPRGEASLSFSSTPIEWRPDGDPAEALQLEGALASIVRDGRGRWIETTRTDRRRPSLRIYSGTMERDGSEPLAESLRLQLEALGYL